MTSPRQYYWNNLHVPYIAPWGPEKPRPYTVVRRHGEGIGYADELDTVDRRYGNLWIRYSAVRGTGTPKLAGVHPLRLRRCMSYMLCQVCGQDSLRSDDRHLFLVRAADGRPITDGEKTTTPPICEPCAGEAVRDCPHLRKGHTASLVEYAEPWGVAGILYDPRTLTPIYADTKDGLTQVAYDDPRIQWTLAAREIVTLNRCTTVELAHLAAQTVAA